MNRYTRLTQLLNELEINMQQARCWQQLPPSQAALNSTMPFCIDTMNLSQWLRFIFIPRMKALIERQGVLPEQISITPLAEEYFRESSTDGTLVLTTLTDIEALLQPNHH